MDKIAICLPTYNEAKNIENITKQVDNSLSRLNNYKSVIVNCDNTSPDETNKIFNLVKTKHKKVSILTSKIGKGQNIINFINYCEINKIDYAFTIDADLKSFEANWIPKMLNELIDDEDFVCPLYKRSRYEGNTTNHFAVPVIYCLYSKIIRQPIGGDYAFNSRFINTFNYYEKTASIKKYGIDIFMLMCALQNNLKISQIELGHKIHASSVEKVEKIFLDVANAVKECITILNYGANDKYDVYDEFFLIQLLMLMNGLIESLE